MYKQYEDDYNEKFNVLTLEERKRQLEKIRNFYKPIPKDELTQHEKNYSSVKREMTIKIKNDRIEESKQIKEHYEKLPYKPSVDK